MTYLSGANLPEHIVTLLVNPPTRLTTAMVAAENLPIAWLAGGAAGGGFVRRLVMEYLPLGSMWDLQRMHWDRYVFPIRIARRNYMLIRDT